jgi:hypothetical protein
MTSTGCQKAMENLFQGRTPRYRRFGIELLTRWQQAGFPSLGDWPSQEIGLDLLDYFLEAMAVVIA